MDRRQSKKIKPGKIIRLAGANLKKTKSEKHSLESNEIEKKNSLRSERFRINFDFIRLKKVKKETDRKTRFAKKKLMKKNNIKPIVYSGWAIDSRKKMHLENIIKVQPRINRFLISTRYF